MSRPWNRMETWLTLAVGGVGLALLLTGTLWVYMSATTRTLFPTASIVPSTSDARSTARWVRAVDQSRQAARAHVASLNLPGLSVAVGVDGEVVWAEGFGWADIDRQAPVTPATRFRMGTASTALTSAAAGLLVEREQLNLDEPIQAYVPEYPETTPPVTIRDLMAHTAGIPSDGGDEGPLYGQQCDRPVEALPAFAGRDPIFAPGTRYSYSRYGWIAVSAAIESAAHTPFLIFMNRAVFAPLGLTDTGPDSGVDARAEGRASSYFPRFAADPRYGPDLMRPIDLSCYAGTSAFVSTPTDLVRFAMAIDDGRFLRPATVALLRSPVRLASGEETGHGLGWDVGVADLAGAPAHMVGFGGDLLGGDVASVVTVQGHRLTVAVLSNISYGSTRTVALAIAGVFSRSIGPARSCAPPFF